MIDEKGLAPRLHRWSTIAPDDYFDQCYSPEPNSGCWLWLGPAYRTNGTMALRPVMRIGSRRQYAYQFSYQRFIGDIPSGGQICHRCNTPLCVNPEHIYAGTSLDNNRDAIRAGTHVSQRSKEFTRRGVDNPASMPVEAVFQDGRRLLFGSQGEASRAGFNANAISDCINGRRRRHRGAIWRPLPAPPSAMLSAAGER